ncbi:MAG: DUF721 domain-containing protein [Chlamydiales bacterium]|nr:DUF721 domain-containing protein [Chlamydiales bacterium]
MKDDSPKLRRIPRNYRGIAPTGRSLGDLLPKVLQSIDKRLATKPDLICKAWPELVGPKIAPMTQAVRFDQGVLHVKVKGSTLLHLLATYEKQRLIAQLQKRFPQSRVKNITFRIG